MNPGDEGSQVQDSRTLASVEEKWVPQVDGPVPVFAAVIQRSGTWLLGLRPDDRRHGGLWEFPGGKLEPGESLTDAACRELREELGVQVESIGRILYRRKDDGSEFEIIFVETTIVGDPQPLDHVDLTWVDGHAITTMKLAPSDFAFTQRHNP